MSRQARAVERAGLYAVQCRTWWWPFWCLWSNNYGPNTFTTPEEALATFAEREEYTASLGRPWKVVNRG